MTSHVGHVYDFRPTRQYVSQERIDSVNGIAFFFSVFFFLMIIKVKHPVGETQVDQFYMHNETVTAESRGC